MDRHPIVSVIVPLRNEERYVATCLDSLLRQDYPKQSLEIFLVDGMSTDDTRRIIATHIARCDHVRLLDNPGRTVPHAMNVGIRAARGQYVVRIDAHTEYASDYISQCVNYLETTAADNVGGPMVTISEPGFQAIVAASYYSPFALGGGRFHDPNFEGYVDTVYLGAFRRQTLLAVGLFDERFTRNQDDELNLRIIRSGGRIYLTPRIRSRYHPRNRLGALFSQHFQYGEWKVAVIAKHGRPARVRHLVPAAFVLFLALGLVGSLFSRIVAITYACVLSVYLGLAVYFSLRSRHVTGVHSRLLLVVVHVVLHLSYGIGFLKGLLGLLPRKLPNGRNSPDPSGAAPQ